MRLISRLVKTDIFVWILFFILGFCLFLGDGKQTMVDAVGTIAVLTLFVIARISLPKQKELSLLSTISWMAMIGYLLVRTLYSNDIGYSIFATLRYVDAALLYFLFVMYGTNKMTKLFLDAIIVFCLFASVCSIAAICMPTWFSFLPPINLLSITYGHNHVADIVLIGYAISLITWILTKKRVYLLLTIFFVAVTMCALARAALLIETLFIVLIAIIHIIKKIKLHYSFIAFGVGMTLIVLIALFIPYQKISSAVTFLPQRTKQQNFIVLRTEYIKQGFRSIHEHPFFGSGPGTFYLTSLRYQSASDKYTLFAHNFLIETTTEIGIVGLCLLLFVLVTSMYPLNIKKENFPILAGIGIIFLYSVFDYSMNYLIVWFLFWSLLGLVRTDAFISRRTTPQKTASLFIWFLVTLAVIGYFLLMFAFFIPNAKTGMLLTDKAVQATQTKTNTIEDILFFHKRNPEILYALAENGKLPIDVQNLYTQFIRYAPYGINMKKIALKKITYTNDLQLLIHIFQDGFLDIPKTYQCHKEISDNDKNKLFQIVSEYKDIKYENEWVAKIYYMLGYFCLATDKNMARDLWKKAADTSRWSYFSIEQARLEWELSGQDAEAIVANNCLQSQLYDAWLCRDFKTIWSKPGTQMDRIMQIPIR